MGQYGVEWKDTDINQKTTGKVQTPSRRHKISQLDKCLEGPANKKTSFRVQETKICQSDSEESKEAEMSQDHYTR
jgi:hypothetical protein